MHNNRRPFLKFVEPEGGGGGSNEPAKTFTQEEVNAFLAKEIGPLKAQIKELKPAADKLAQIEADQQTEVEKLIARAEAAEKKVGDFEARDARVALLDAIAAEKKLDAKAKGLLAKSSISDETALREYAGELAEAFTAAPKIPTPLYPTSEKKGDLTSSEAAARANATALLKGARS